MRIFLHKTTKIVFALRAHIEDRAKKSATSATFVVIIEKFGKKVPQKPPPNVHLICHLQTQNCQSGGCTVGKKLPANHKRVREKQTETFGKFAECSVIFSPECVASTAPKSDVQALQSDAPLKNQRNGALCGRAK